MDTKRIESFTLNKRKFVYFDFSRIMSNDDMLEMTTSAKAYMQKTDPESAVYAIINVDSAIADSKTKAILTDWLEFNSKYVLHAAIINLDGTRKIMYNSILKSLGLKNIKYFPTRQLAVDYLSEA